MENPLRPSIERKRPSDTSIYFHAVVNSNDRLRKEHKHFFKGVKERKHTMVFRIIMTLLSEDAPNQPLDTDINTNGV